MKARSESKKCQFESSIALDPEAVGRLITACEWLRDNPDSPISAREHVLKALAGLRREE